MAGSSTISNDFRKPDVISFAHRADRPGVAASFVLQHEDKENKRVEQALATANEPDHPPVTYAALRKVDMVF